MARIAGIRLPLYTVVNGEERRLGVLEADLIARITDSDSDSVTMSLSIGDVTVTESTSGPSDLAGPILVV